MDSDPETDPEIEPPKRQIPLADLQLQYSALVVQCKDLDDKESHRRLEIKRVLQQDVHDTILATQFDDVMELLRNALAQVAELERSAQSDSSKIGAELSSVKVLLQKAEEYGRSLEGSVKEARERLAAERVKVQDKQEKIEEEERRVKEVQEQLIEEQEKVQESNEGLQSAIQRLSDANERLEVVQKELEQARKGKTQQMSGARKELDGLIEENEALKAESVKLRREKDRLQAELSSLNDVSSKANNLLAENISLTHQVSSLKTELDSLRSIEGLHNTHLAEKLELRRQFTNIEFKLEDSKNMIERLKESVSASSGEERKLRKELAEAKAAFQKESRAREQAEMEVERVREDWEGKEKILKARIDAGKRTIKGLRGAASEGKSINEKKRVAPLTMEDLEATTVKKPRLRGPQPTHSEFSTTPFFKKVSAPVQGGAKRVKGVKRAPGDETVLDSGSDDWQGEGEGEMEGEGEGEHEAEEVEEDDEDKRQEKEKVTTEGVPPAHESVKENAQTTNGAINNARDHDTQQDDGGPKSTKPRAKEKKAPKPKSGTRMTPILVGTSPPPKLLLAGANKKPKKAPLATTTTTAATTPGTEIDPTIPAPKQDRAASSPMRPSSTIIIDDIFESQNDTTKTTIPESLAVPPVPKGRNRKPTTKASTTKASTTAAKKRAPPGGGGSGPAGATSALPRAPTAKTLFDDADGSGRLDMNLDRNPVLLNPGLVGNGAGEAMGRGPILTTEFSPQKKRPKGASVRVGVAGKKEQ